MYKTSTASLYFTFSLERKSCAIFVQICLNKKKENCFLIAVLKYSLYKITCADQFTQEKCFSVSTRNSVNTRHISRETLKFQKYDTQN